MHARARTYLPAVAPATTMIRRTAAAAETLFLGDEAFILNAW